MTLKTSDELIVTYTRRPRADGRTYGRMIRTSSTSTFAGTSNTAWDVPTRRDPAVWEITGATLNDIPLTPQEMYETVLLPETLVASWTRGENSLSQGAESHFTNMDAKVWQSLEWITDMIRLGRRLDKIAWDDEEISLTELQRRITLLREHIPNLDGWVNHPVTEEQADNRFASQTWALDRV